MALRASHFAALTLVLALPIGAALGQSGGVKRTKKIAAIPSSKTVATTIETKPDGSTVTTTTTTTTRSTSDVKRKAKKKPALPVIQPTSKDAFVSKTYLPYKKRLLAIMGTAKERVILGSSLLADSEVVSFLYLAKYRGLKVTVILDPRYARARSSRLSYLRKNQIPTIIYSMAKLPLQQDFVKVDTNSYSLKGFLAPQYARGRTYEIFKEPIYVDAKLDAMLAVLKTRPDQLRRRPRRGGSRLALPASGGERIPAEGYNYNFGARQTKAPPGMATALPRRTISDKATRGAKPQVVVPRPVGAPNHELLGQPIEGEQPLPTLPPPDSSSQTTPAGSASQSDRSMPASPSELGPEEQEQEQEHKASADQDPFSAFEQNN